MASGIPPDVRRLIRTHLGTMSHVDALVSLARSDGWVTPESVAGEMSMSAQVATACLQDFVETGLATFEDREDTRRYRLDPIEVRDRQAVDAVIGLRNSRPVSLVRYMYEGSTDLLE